MNTEDIVVTQHAYDRAKERMKWSTTVTLKMAILAYNSGISHKETKGNLRNYVSKLFFEYGVANNTKIYGEDIYLFRDNTLITLYRLPQSLVKLANKISNQLKTNNMSTETRELTFGEKAVGLTFNPGGHTEVDSIKKQCAVLIDSLNDARNATDSSDKKRMYSEAITNIQTGQMWGVKAATWQF